MKTILRYPTQASVTSACRFATGRSCIWHLANRWQPDHVFMPSFVPEGVIDPFIALGVNIVFYRLTESLAVDLVDLREKMEANEGKRPLVVAIGYFGMEKMIEGVASVAHQFGGIMLADCAHAMIGSATTDADAFLYSLNKFLPVADGALIGSRNPDLDLSVDHSSLPPLPRFVIDNYNRHLRANAAIAAAPIGSDVSADVEESDLAYDEYYDFIKSFMEPMAQSAESRAMEASVDATMLIAARYVRGSILSQRIEEALLLRDPQTPQFAFPIRCLGERERMIAAMNSIGILPSVLTDRWDHVPTNGGFEIERQFVDDHLLLPINESVDVEALIKVSKLLNGFTKGEPCETTLLH